MLLVLWGPETASPSNLGSSKPLTSSSQDTDLRSPEPAPVPTLTWPPLSESHIVPGCEVELITEVTALTKLCADQIMLEGEEVKGAKRIHGVISSRSEQ